jgi:hypothetical protein
MPEIENLQTGSCAALEAQIALPGQLLSLVCRKSANQIREQEMPMATDGLVPFTKLRSP